MTPAPVAAYALTDGDAEGEAEHQRFDRGEADQRQPHFEVGLRVRPQRRDAGATR